MISGHCHRVEIVLVAMTAFAVTVGLMTWAAFEQVAMRKSRTPLWKTCIPIWRKTIKKTGASFSNMKARGAVVAFDYWRIGKNEMILSLREEGLNNPAKALFHVSFSQSGDAECRVLLPRSIVTFVVWWVFLNVCFGAIWLKYGGASAGVIAPAGLAFGLVFFVFVLVGLQYSAVLAFLGRKDGRKTYQGSD